MPTGYTAAIKDGIEFPAFALHCARAFGALITMRDDPSDAAIPEEFKPSMYHKDALESAKALALSIALMSDEEAQQKADAEYTQALKRHNEIRAEDAVLGARYQAMLAQVDAWQPPTSEHVGLKTFMTEQLRESIRFDCDYDRKPPVALTGAQWMQMQTAKAQRDIAYHTKEDAEEVRRAAERTAWITALRTSLTAPVRVRG